MRGIKMEIMQMNIGQISKEELHDRWELINE
jgi:hypothetical protein